MSSYFDYVVERLEDAHWKFAAKSTYADDEAINPYTLKDVFWDTEFQNGVPIDITNEAKSEFCEKVGTYNRKEKDVFKNAIVEITIPICVDRGDIKAGVLYNLDILSKDYRTKFRDTLIRIYLDGIAKYWKDVKTYLHFADCDEEIYNKETVDVNELRNWIDKGVIDNIFKINDTYQFACETPYSAILHLRGYNMLKTVESPTEILVGEISQVIYNDKDGNEIPQYKLKHSTRCSTTKDVDLMIDYLKADIERIKKSNTTENLARDIIRNLINERANEEDKETNLYKELMSYCGEEEVYGDEEYLQELETQLHEVEKIRSVMGPSGKGRLIWGIS